jgi:hypothetical protein
MAAILRSRKVNSTVEIVEIIPATTINPGLKGRPAPPPER